MIRFLIALAALSLLANCNVPPCTSADWPMIGSCLPNAGVGDLGGQCNVDNTCNAPNMACASGICYICGDIADTPEPCCGEGTPQYYMTGGVCTSGMCRKDGESLEWFTCGTGAPDSLGCESGQTANFQVGVLDATCSQPKIYDICADDLSKAQSLTSHLGPQGPVGPRDMLTPPSTVVLCGTNKANDDSDCIVGSSDESKGTKFWFYTQDQLTTCESNFDANCDWSTMAGSDGMCQPMP